MYTTVHAYTNSFPLVQTRRYQIDGFCLGHILMLLLGNYTVLFGRIDGSRFVLRNETQTINTVYSEQRQFSRHRVATQSKGQLFVTAAYLPL